MLNAIPFFGWFLSALFAISLAVPFWFIWSVCGIGETYAYWLPQVYKHPGFWDCVGVFIVIGIIKTVFLPRLATSSSSSNNSKD
jgi:hypothetical protein